MSDLIECELKHEPGEEDMNFSDPSINSNGFFMTDEWVVVDLKIEGGEEEDLVDVDEMQLKIEPERTRTPVIRARETRQKRVQAVKLDAVKVSRPRKANIKKRDGNAARNPTNLTKRKTAYPKKTNEKAANDKELFECDFCKKLFKMMYRLAEHMRTHTGEKPFPCKMCSKSFTRSNDLAKHVRAHTGERPFECKICFKAFLRSSYLVGHMRTHSGERPFMCEVCSKAFVNASDLTRHRRIHRGERRYNCDLCSKDFACHTALQVHKRAHSGERPYECYLCTKSFPSQNRLTRHIAAHSDDRSFVCSMCSESFNSQYRLRCHVKTHLGKGPPVDLETLKIFKANF